MEPYHVSLKTYLLTCTILVVVIVLFALTSTLLNQPTENSQRRLIRDGFAGRIEYSTSEHGNVQIYIHGLNTSYWVETSSYDLENNTIGVIQINENDSVFKCRNSDTIFVIRDSVWRHSWKLENPEHITGSLIDRRGDGLCALTKS
jgi:hypothetical protein